jgi:hypothetical protein
VLSCANNGIKSLERYSKSIKSQWFHIYILSNAVRNKDFGDAGEQGNTTLMAYASEKSFRFPTPIQFLNILRDLIFFRLSAHPADCQMLNPWCPLGLSRAEIWDGNPGCDSNKVR